MIDFGGSKQKTSASSLSTSSQQTAPWEGQAGFLRDIYGRAQGIASGAPYGYYPGSTVSGFAPESERGFGMGERRAMAGSDVTRAASGQAAGTLRGDFLGANPYLDKMMDAASRGVTRNYKTAVLPTLRSRFAGAGRVDPEGGGAMGNAENRAMDTLGTNLSEMATNIYGGSFEAERGRQMGALGMSPQLADAEYRDANALRNIGAQREERSQMVLDDLVNRYNFNQFEPAMKLAEFAQFIGGPVMASQAESRATSRSAGKGMSFNAGIF